MNRCRSGSAILPRVLSTHDKRNSDPVMNKAQSRHPLPRHLLAGLATIMLMAPLSTAHAAGTGQGGVAVRTSGSVQDTLGTIKKMVAANGMMVMGELHQGQVLKMTGLNVESESIFVGNPTVGKKLFSAEPGAGVAVPIRINVYRDSDGGTVVRYVPPSHQLGSFKSVKVKMVAAMLDDKLKKMVSMLPR